MMARLQPNSRTVELLLNRTLDPKAQAQAAARAHRGFVAEATAINRRVLGIDPPSETFVDGRKGAALESVKIDGGVMLTRFALINDIVDDIWRMLVEHSPVLSGNYRDSHRLFADGVEVDPAVPHPGAKEFIFISTLPYARKIERGQSDQSPDGVYEGVATLAKSRFGNLASIRFTFRDVIGGATGDRKQKAATQTANRFPAILITMR